VDLGKEGVINVSVSSYSIIHTRQIVMHCSVSYLKCCETLSFLVRDVVHITPENFSNCVSAIRTFVEASYRGDFHGGDNLNTRRSGNAKSAVKNTPTNKQISMRKTKSEPRHGGYEADESSDEELVCEYTHVTLQLLDLMHVLLTRALGVQTAWAREPAELWDMAWCPVLQGMARLCCDTRQQVRTQSLTLLQRSLLLPDLQVLSPSQWEFAFLRVLFPMLRKLLELGRNDRGREETKLRAAMMLSKVFLQHLTPLSSLPTFPALWLSILDIIGQFCATASTDLLADALPESLKNLLLVMDTSGLFFTEQGQVKPLWGVTWGKIDTFLPTLRDQLFPGWQNRAQHIQIATDEKQDQREEEKKPSTDPEIFQTPSTVESSAAPPVTVTLPATLPVEPGMTVIHNQPLGVRGSISSLPDHSTVSSSIPTSPMEAPVKPCTAFSLPTSPSRQPGNMMTFTPISVPMEVMAGPLLLATPRPLLARPPTGWRLDHPQTPLVPGMTQSSDNTAFSNPLLASVPININHLPQFVATTNQDQDQESDQHLNQ